MRHWRLCHNCTKPVKPVCRVLSSHRTLLRVSHVHIHLRRASVLLLGCSVVCIMHFASLLARYQRGTKVIRALPNLSCGILLRRCRRQGAINGTVGGSMQYHAVSLAQYGLKLLTSSSNIPPQCCAHKTHNRQRLSEKDFGEPYLKFCQICFIIER